MKFTKKLSVIIAALAVLLSLCACTIVFESIDDDDDYDTEDHDRDEEDEDKDKAGNGLFGKGKGKKEYKVYEDSSSSADLIATKENIAKDAYVSDDAGVSPVVEPALDEIVMATNASFPPYEYYENGEIVGIDVEIAEAIADKLGFDLEIKDMAFDAIITSVMSGKADFGMAGMTATVERLESVDFSIPYITNTQVVVVDENSSVMTVDDLYENSYIIGVETNSTADVYASYDFGNVVRYINVDMALQALKSGEVDCVIVDGQDANEKSYKKEGLKILDTPYTEESYAICVKKGNDELLKKINDAIRKLKSDGTIAEVIN